jgi:cell wall-associated NlpC family hydrolase
LALGLAAVAVTSIGVGTAAVGDVGGSTPVATTASPAPTAPALAAPTASPTTTASPAPKPVTMWVRVAAANVWFKTAWVRRVDRPSLTANPHLARWVRGMSYRQRLGLGRNLMTQALRGEQVSVLTTTGRWAKVRLPQQRGSVYRSGIVGWMPKVQLSAAPVAAAPVQQLPKRGSSLIRAARAYLGSTYIFGGMTRAGIDCSGLTYLAAEHVGIVLPRDAADQALVGKPVRRQALRPGDLVFFGRGSRDSIHHVGIYVGHGRILHAPHTGSSVRISRLSSFRDYWGARRLVPSD